MPKIFVTDRAGKEHTLEVDVGLTIMEPLRELDDGVEALCGGMCSCATCHVFVDPAWTDKLPKRHGDELELLESTESFIDRESRLSCQVRMTEELDGIRV